MRVVMNVPNEHCGPRDSVCASTMSPPCHNVDKRSRSTNFNAAWSKGQPVGHIRVHDLAVNRACSARAISIG